MAISIDSRVSYPTTGINRCWAGALTDKTFKVIADTDQTISYARLVVSPNSDLSNPTYVSSYQAPFKSTGTIQSFQTFSYLATGLTANTQYYYQIQGRGAPSHLVIRSIKTAPAAGTAAAFTFVTSGCSHIHGNANNHSAYTSLVHRGIAQDNPLFYLHLDDLSYADPDDTTPKLAREHLARKYLRAYDTNSMCQTVPLTWMPGDHDMAGNDTDLVMTNGEQIMVATRQAYLETTPYYPFASPSDANGIPRVLTQVFDIAKVRFIMFDCFSQARMSTGNALGSGSGNGDYWDQRTWLQQQLSSASGDGIKWLFLCSPRSWQDYNQHSYNDWFPTERTWICDQIEQCAVPVCLVYGDSHITILDDGTHGASYSTSGFTRFPVMASSSTFTDTLDPASSSSTWNGSSMKYSPNFGASKGTGDGGYIKFTFSADNSTWTAKMRGTPYNTSTFAATDLFSISSTDVTPAVSFNNTSPTATHGVQTTIDLNKTWFGACSVNWTASTGQTGTATFSPNKTRTSFNVTFAAAGTPTLTLSSPTGCTITGTNPITVTVS